MDQLSMCRICLIKDVRMHCLVNTDLQEIYELLTGKLLETRDRRPVDACYVCCARLRNCLQLRSACLHSAEFTHLLDNDDFEVKPLLSTLHTIPAICMNVDSVLHRELTQTTGDPLDEEHVGDLEDNIVEQGMCTQLIQQQYVKCEDVTLEDDDSIPNVGEDSNAASDDYCLQNDPLEIDISKSDHSISCINFRCDMSHLNSFDNASTVSSTLNPADLEDTSQCTNINKQPTGEKLFKCNICGKAFGLTAYLLSHIRTHTDEILHKCGMCGKEYDVKAKLSNHIRTHTGKTPFKCFTCGKRFYRNYCLTAHLVTHTGEKPFVCDICGKGFYTKDRLILHIHTHTGEKPYKCITRGKRFGEKSNLSKHIRIQTGENRSKCSTCGKALCQKIQLMEHTCAHTNEKPYKCVTCGKGFAAKSNLLKHIRTHTKKAIQM